MIYSYSVILIVLWKFTPRDFTCLSLVQRKLVFSASEPTRFHPKSLLLFLPPPPPPILLYLTNCTHVNFQYTSAILFDTFYARDYM